MTTGHARACRGNADDPRVVVFWTAVQRGVCRSEHLVAASRAREIYHRTSYARAARRGSGPEPQRYAVLRILPCALWRRTPDSPFRTRLLACHTLRGASAFIPSSRSCSFPWIVFILFVSWLSENPDRWQLKGSASAGLRSQLACTPIVWAPAPAGLGANRRACH
jgi:hypothetical protein